MVKTDGLKQKLLRLQSECYKIVKTNTRTGSMVVSAGQMARKQAFDEVLGLLDEATKQIQENTFEIMVKDEIEHERLVRGKERFFTYPMKTINVVKLEQVLAFLEGDKKKDADS